MDKKRSGGTVCRPARIVFPLGKFLARLHQCIGGAGPVQPGPATECAAFGRDHPDHSLSVADFRVEYLWANIMKKYDDGNKSTHKRDAALKSSREAENRCASTPSEYHRRKTDSVHWQALRPHATPDAVISTVRRKIFALLGDFDWESALDHVGFGPGATTALSRRQADLWYKFEAVPQASTTCVPLVTAYLGSCNLLWKEALLGKGGETYTICDANTVTTVPKNSKTDRPIAIEPQWNMFFQKGIGGVIRERLRRVGVDLNDQSHNRERAAAGSQDGLLATLDLSSASDTVSRWLVHELLPPDWIEAMERCRSPISVLPSGERILLRKFSSMGNGFTFELESLIFWAISSTVVQFVRKDSKLKDHRVSIYGDDIIVPVDCYEPLRDALDLLGFIPNDDKSYASGPFRESCGMHAFMGHDVTPFFIREPVNSLDRLFLLHNNLVRWSQLRYNGVRDESVKELCRWVRSFAPVEWRRPRLPDGYGDTAFIGSFDECRPNTSETARRFTDKDRSVYFDRGFEVKVWAPCPSRYDQKRASKTERKGFAARFEDTPRLLRTLWHLRNPEVSRWGVAGSNRPDTPLYVSLDRGAFSESWVYVRQWTDMGPWVSFQDDITELAVGIGLQAHVEDGEAETPCRERQLS